MLSEYLYTFLTFLAAAIVFARSEAVFHACVADHEDSVAQVEEDLPDIECTAVDKKSIPRFTKCRRELVHYP